MANDRATRTPEFLAPDTSKILSERRADPETRAHMSFRGASEQELDVGKFMPLNTSDFNKYQQPSTSGLQQVQYQSLRNNAFQ
jgi:hypothetical protein